MGSSALLLYGAEGYTGRLILAEAPEEFNVISAARHVSETQIGVTLPLDLSDSAALVRALSGCDVVLNCAGPFANTWPPLIEACLETRTHYLDLCAEWAVFEELQRQGDRARERGVMLLPGVGFDVVASDCLAAHVAQKLPTASKLAIGISGLELASRGSANTILDLAGEPIRVRRAGQIASERQIREASFDFGAGSRPAYAVSWGDVSTAFRTTGIPNIEVFFEATPVAMGLTLANRSFGWMLRSPILRRAARAQIRLLPDGPSLRERAGRRAAVVARATDDSGGLAEARLSTPEAYTFTAASAVAIVQRVMEGAIQPGFQTPAGLLGADFVLGLDGVTRTDL